jgi:hypothetical protein
VIGHHAPVVQAKGKRSRGPPVRDEPSIVRPRTRRRSAPGAETRPGRLGIRVPLLLVLRLRVLARRIHRILVRGRRLGVVPRVDGVFVRGIVLHCAALGSLTRGCGAFPPGASAALSNGVAAGRPLRSARVPCHFLSPI